MDQASDPNLTIGLEHPDDAAVYRMPSGDLLIQTVDIIAPIVDDPYTFGRIACANALSDVYAMGGRPLTAMNVVSFPSQKLPIETVRQIMRGANDTLTEAGCLLVGGHTLDGEDFRFGFSVSGIVEHGQPLSIDRAQVGQVLVLTKPIGTGVVFQALRNGRIAEDSPTFQQSQASMSALNMVAAQAARKVSATSMTDVTGFGLLGHCAQFARASQVTFEFDRDAIPTFEGVRTLIREGFTAGRALENLRMYERRIDGIADEHEAQLLMDPQTSGGLLIPVPESEVPSFVEFMHARAMDAHIVGRVRPHATYDVVVC